MTEIYTVLCGCCESSEIEKIEVGTYKFLCRKNGDDKTPEEVGYEDKNHRFGCDDFEFNL
jgi:hypothetical protein